MRNRILSITRSNIPYVKELHPLTGSVIGCLVMQQLDYWFTSQPEGFYKFLEPADHPAYKEGDSWVEELAMSREEFRYAFDRIATRYKSRTEYQKAANAGDPFKGKFYCSFVDRRANLTYYFRNHEVVDAALDQLIYEGNTNSVRKPKVITKTDSPTVPEIMDVAVTDCSVCEIPVGGNPALQRWKSGFTEVEIPLCRGGNPALQEEENPLYVKRLFRGPLLQRLLTETTTTTTEQAQLDDLSTKSAGNEPPSGCSDDSVIVGLDPGLVWPVCSLEEKAALAEMIGKIPPEQHQILLDELEGNRITGRVRSGLIPLARSLVRAMRSGTFAVSHAPAVAARRREQASKRDQVVSIRKPPEISMEELATGQAVLSKILGEKEIRPSQTTSSLQS